MEILTLQIVGLNWEYTAGFKVHPPPKKKKNEKKRKENSPSTVGPGVWCIMYIYISVLKLLVEIYIFIC